MKGLVYILSVFLISALKIPENPSELDKDGLDTADPPEGLALYTRRVVKEGILPDVKLGDDEYYSQLRAFIKKSCGTTCEYSRHEGKGKFYDTVSKPNECSTLFSENMMALDGLSNRFPPPTEIPKVMLADFTMGDEKMPLQNWYIDDTMLAKGDQSRRLARWRAKWEKSRIEEYIKSIKGGNYHTGYSIPETKAIYEAMMMYKSELAGSHVAVIGSQRPWVEVLLLAVGVKNITTIEYTDLSSDHPQLNSLHPSDMDKIYAKGELFDHIVTYSSLEHAGLGRYGDIVNPWGDLISMSKASCITKPGGLMLMGWPMDDKNDNIAWNAHRYYGPKRWAQILANTEQVYKQDGICHAKGASPYEVCQGFMIARKI